VGRCPLVALAIGDPRISPSPWAGLVAGFSSGKQILRTRAGLAIDGLNAAGGRGRSPATGITTAASANRICVGQRHRADEGLLPGRSRLTRHGREASTDMAAARRPRWLTSYIRPAKTRMSGRRVEFYRDLLRFPPTSLPVDGRTGLRWLGGAGAFAGPFADPGRAGCAPGRVTASVNRCARFEDNRGRAAELGRGQFEVPAQEGQHRRTPCSPCGNSGTGTRDGLRARKGLERRLPSRADIAGRPVGNLGYHTSYYSFVIYKHASMQEENGRGMDFQRERICA